MVLIMGDKKMNQNEIKCNEHRPIGFFERISMWLEDEEDRHAWQYYKKRSGNIVYSCRKCECGAEQVKADGALGDGEWRDVSDMQTWRYDWELKHFFDASL